MEIRNRCLLGKCLIRNKHSLKNDLVYTNDDEETLKQRLNQASNNEEINNEEINSDFYRRNENSSALDFSEPQTKNIESDFRRRTRKMSNALRKQSRSNSASQHSIRDHDLSITYQSGKVPNLATFPPFFDHSNILHKHQQSGPSEHSNSCLMNNAFPAVSHQLGSLTSSGFPWIHAPLL